MFLETNVFFFSIENNIFSFFHTIYNQKHIIEVMFKRHFRSLSQRKNKTANIKNNSNCHNQIVQMEETQSFGVASLLQPPFEIFLISFVGVFVLPY